MLKRPLPSLSILPLKVVYESALRGASNAWSAAAVLGSITAFVLIKAHFGRTVRRCINWCDPILPPSAAVKAALADGNLLAAADVEAHIREIPGAVLRGAERQVVWAGNPGTKTPLCVVYLHGWSSCRQECHPVPELVAAAFGANLFCTRLPGHGRYTPRSEHPCGDSLLREAKPTELFKCALEALRMGLSLGDRVILFGCSTGGALATWLATLKEAQPDIAGLVLISPAYGLGHPLYPVLKHTFAVLRLLPKWLCPMVRSSVIDAALGPARSSAPVNKDHGRFTAMRYPSAALLHLLDVLWVLETADHGAITAPSFKAGNPDDGVVNFRVKATHVFLRFGDVPRALYCVTNSQHAHVITGAILSPSTVHSVADAAITFLKAHVASGRCGGSDNRRLRTRSVPSGLGSYASFASLQDLAQPFDV